jgi:hypothetical protein
MKVAMQTTRDQTSACEAQLANFASTGFFVQCWNWHAYRVDQTALAGARDQEGEDGEDEDAKDDLQNADG